MVLVTFLRGGRYIKKGSCVIFHFMVEHVNNLIIVLNSRMATGIKDIKVVHDVINITRFSSLKKLIMVTGYVIFL